MRFCPLLWGVVGTCSKMYQTTVCIALRDIIHSCDTISFELYCFCLWCFNGAVVLWAWDALWQDAEPAIAHWVICGRAKAAAGKYVRKANLENLHSVVTTGLFNAALCKTQAVSGLFISILKCLTQDTAKTLLHRFLFPSLLVSWVGFARKSSGSYCHLKYALCFTFLTCNRAISKTCFSSSKTACVEL